MTKKKSDSEKLPMGAPSKFLTKINPEIVEMLYRKGFTDKEVAKVLEVDEASIHNWKKEHPDFFESLKSWKDEADEKIERSLYERAVGYSHPDTKYFCHEGYVIAEPTTKHYPPDVTAQIFWLKNRKSKEWRDRVENLNANFDSNVTYEQYLKSLEEDKNE